METQPGPTNPAEAVRVALVRFLTLLAGKEAGVAPVGPLKKSQLHEHSCQSLADQAAQQRSQQ